MFDLFWYCNIIWKWVEVDKNCSLFIDNIIDNIKMTFFVLNQVGQSLGQVKLDSSKW
jgi:hypothetical protein